MQKHPQAERGGDGGGVVRVGRGCAWRLAHLWDVPLRADANLPLQRQHRLVCRRLPYGELHLRIWVLQSEGHDVWVSGGTTWNVHVQHLQPAD